MPAVGDQHRGGPACVMMPNSTGSMSSNPFEEPQRRINEYTAQEIATLQARLDKKLGPEYISSRPGAAGQKVHYLSADKCINLANEVFGFNGWSSSIQNIQIDFVEESQHTGKISLGLSVIVRVTLKDGTFHEDIGYGHIENCKGKAAAFEKAKKEGTTDALKRALRNFGNVLGNCIYDKDYVSKVIKVKTAPARWEVNELHRHPDFAPIKKEPVRPMAVPEDDDLPPRPATIVKNISAIDTATLDGDGEFGSDLFDEADFGVAATGNPDEVVLEPETRPRLQPPTPANAQPSIRAPQGSHVRPNPAIVTPSKPERPIYANRQPPVTSTLNGKPNPSVQKDQYAGQSRPLQGPQQTFQNGRVVPAAQSKTSQDSALSDTTTQVPIKRELDTRAQDIAPPADSPAFPPASFFSARAVDLLRENPHTAVTAPQFDPHAESPSIRKTAGVDHSKSLPVLRPMLAGASPGPNNTRDFINPSMDMHRKIGAPGGGPGSPMMNRSQTTSSYRPLTRQNIDPKQAANSAFVNRAGFGPPNTNGKRPPLNDVTNATTTGDSRPVSMVNANDPKRPRIDSNAAPSLPPQQQQQ